MINSKTIHGLIYDPISFTGGSKIATSDALALCDSQRCQFTVITSDPTFWQNSSLAVTHSLKVVRLPEIKSLKKKQHGLGYWLKQGFQALTLLIQLGLIQKTDFAIGASGPGVDMPLYLLKRVFNLKVIQFIHGPVGASRSIGHSLFVADQVFYLKSARATMENALQRYYRHHETSTNAVQSQIQQFFYRTTTSSFDNGISDQRWPSPSVTEEPVLFWCASLLKWKGLDIFLDAVKQTRKLKYLEANVCFIRPKDISLSVSTAPINLKGVNWYEQPNDLDKIRAQSSIFISTSTNEPFGLSILEALAAGHAVLIPDDGAYWDQVLTHNMNCIKYKAGDMHALCDAILLAACDANLRLTLRKNAIEFSQKYRAVQCYSQIAHTIDSLITKEPVTLMASSHNKGDA